MALFDEIIAKGKTFDLEDAVRDLFGLEKKPDETRAKDGQVAEVVQELRELTTDDDAETVMLRSVAVWRTLVKHVKAGGTVKLIGPGTEVRTLKVRLR